MEHNEMLIPIIEEFCQKISLLSNCMPVDLHITIQANNKLSEIFNNELTARAAVITLIMLDENSNRTFTKMYSPVTGHIEIKENAKEKETIKKTNSTTNTWGRDANGEPVL